MLPCPTVVLPDKDKFRIFQHCVYLSSNRAAVTALVWTLNFNIGIKHGFSCINIRQVPWEVLKTQAKGRGFQHFSRDLANVNALNNHVPLLLLHKN